MFLLVLAYPGSPGQKVCVCVCACVRACVRACMCVLVSPVHSNVNTVCY